MGEELMASLNQILLEMKQNLDIVTECIKQKPAIRDEGYALILDEMIYKHIDETMRLSQEYFTPKPEPEQKSIPDPRLDKGGLLGGFYEDKPGEDAQSF
jgi:hypothetical protein